jgi:hypothetical protein
MALSDCPKCWSTPCNCGYQYRNWPKDRRVALAALLLEVTPTMLTKSVVNDAQLQLKAERGRGGVPHSKQRVV